MADFKVYIKRHDAVMKKLDAMKEYAGKRKVLTVAQAGELGSLVIEAMKRQIKVGVSPIAEGGKFPKYKAAGEKQEAEKEHGKGKKGRASVKEKTNYSNRYPYNKMKQYPDKKVTPVNLRLRGKFLEALKYDVREEREKGIARNVTVIRIEGQANQDIERGHREGANGQPKRPIIPINKERPNAFIAAKISGFLLKIMKQFVSDMSKKK